MKPIKLLFCTLMLLTGMHAAAQTHTIVATEYSVRTDAANQAVFYSLAEGNQGKA